MGSKVHTKLYESLSAIEIEQTVYYPVRLETFEKSKNYQPTSSFSVVPSQSLKKYHKLLFVQRINHLYKDITNKIALREFDIIHATTLFADGALAWKIHKNFGIPYILAVRGTDLNLYFKYRPDLLSLARSILLGAKKIIFISDSIKHSFFNLPALKRYGPKLTEKSKTVYNGIESFWLQNLKEKKNITPRNILYIGRFDSNKNALRLVQSVIELKDNYPDVKITLIGKKGEEEEKIKELSTIYPELVEFLGPIYDKEKLESIFFQSHIFAMPSFSESFGLVYIEALSQGLPVLFSKGQGIDRVFTQKIGESVNPSDINSIKVGLQEIINNYHDYNLGAIDFLQFDWEKIASKYQEIYAAIISKK